MSARAPRCCSVNMLSRREKTRSHAAELGAIAKTMRAAAAQLGISSALPFQKSRTVLVKAGMSARFTVMSRTATENCGSSCFMPVARGASNGTHFLSSSTSAGARNDSPFSLAKAGPVTSMGADAFVLCCARVKRGNTRVVDWPPERDAPGLEWEGGNPRAGLRALATRGGVPRGAFTWRWPVVRESGPAVMLSADTFTGFW
mmetsp:Transcript_11982/g.35566  ORF Transcript_11982/g.35566 Transcript_11982/m.35566 type:complete len:202 (+) Transcript_11982:36-641(+)